MMVPCCQYCLCIHGKEMWCGNKQCRGCHAKKEPWLPELNDDTAILYWETVALAMFGCVIVYSVLEWLGAVK